ncbi:MAG: pantetheine-phosphate adenylyltransferase [Campylobacteraceae bacterium 4484_4]|nr:MAG: pantetheine-phosphate adenylyltransferase [Campylobacteraceae bacterium 4484_4]
MQHKALYPGTFDPITNGHLDIIRRAGKIFDTVTIAIAESREKHPMFSLQKRAAMVRAATETVTECRIEVVTFDTLLVDLAHKEETEIIIRGLRAVSDFEYELQMGYANASLDPEIETIYLMPSLKNAFISSSVVRAILKHHGDVSHLVSKSILPFLYGEGDVLSV